MSVELDSSQLMTPGVGRWQMAWRLPRMTFMLAIALFGLFAASAFCLFVTYVLLRAIGEIQTRAEEEDEFFLD